LILACIHAGGPEVADDLLHAGGLRVGGGLLGELALYGDRALIEHFERAPRRAVARDRVGGQPLAVDVATEVGARVLGGIEIGDGEAVDARQLALVELVGGGFGRLGGVGDRCGLLLLGARRQGGGDGNGQHQDLRFFEAHNGLRPDWR
jgi:hypothetical protein